MRRPNPLLTDLLEADPCLGFGECGRVFVPGCGSGWDAKALAEAGWDVTAVDVAADAIALAREIVPSAVVGDALNWQEEPFDVIFDHTFFCALHPDKRSDFGRMVERLLAPTGQLISVVFPIGRSPADAGPPWGMTPEDVDSVMSDGMVRTETGPEINIGGRRWPHRLCVWVRRTQG